MKGNLKELKELEYKENNCDGRRHAEFNEYTCEFECPYMGCRKLSEEENVGNER